MHADHVSAGELGGREGPAGDVDRRGFMRLTGGAALGAALGSLGVRFTWAQEAGGAQVSVVGFPNGADAAAIAARLAEAIGAVSDLAWLKPGDLVAIKVASNSGRPYPFTTHPVALQALIRMLRARGARVIVADQAGIEWVLPPLGGEKLGEKVRELWRGLHSGTATGMQVLEMNGLKAAAEAAGAEVQSFDREADWEAHPPTTHWKQGFRVPRLYREVAHVINFARPSAHVMLGHTTAIKNWYGWLHPLDRMRSHTDVGIRPPKDWLSLRFKQVRHLPERIAEVAAAFAGKTRLNLVAAIDTYCDVGPDWGTQPLAQSSIMASGDMLAIDAASAALVAWEKRRVPAAERKENWRRSPHLNENERFWGSIEGGFHDFHGARVLDALIEEPRAGGIWQVEQDRHAREIGLGSDKLALSTSGTLDPAFLEGLTALTGGTAQPAQPGASQRGLIDELRDAGKQ